MWEIVNTNNIRWGRETYPTREAAELELKTFWKGVSGVDLKKFTIRNVCIMSNETLEGCIDCDGTGRYPSGAACKSCEGTGRVGKGDGFPVESR